MRLIGPFAILLSLVSCAIAQDFEAPNVRKEKLGYQSDVSRLRNIVINSLYSHRDVFLRELISNANDAIEKLRLTSLTDKTVYDGSSPLNITIKAFKDEDGKGGRIVISDTGIGMSKDELTANLGTLAKSGTSEFLSKADGLDSTGTGNLIGAFGVGFYSSFLVADKVYVASVPPKSAKNPNPVQHVFSSSAADSDFEVFEDPRGNTLGRGTEITLVLKEDAQEYLDSQKLGELVSKHSSFSTAFPIYLWTTRTEEVPDEDVSEAPETPLEEAKEETEGTSEAKEVSENTDAASDDEEAVVEDVAEESKKTEPEAPKKTKQVTVEEWVRSNPTAPIWTRDPKDVTEEEYRQFYQATFKDYNDPTAWYHFSGDSGAGTSFKAIIYLPSKIDDNYWQTQATTNKDIRLMVKKVFITSDLGDDFLPKWANYIKVIVDADDLPLNVSRETLQSTKFLKQMKSILVRRLVQLFSKIEKDDPIKFNEIQEKFGTAIKLGAVEDSRNREKIVQLARFATNQRNATSLNEYVKNKRGGQKQIFFLADMGKDIDFLAKSVFVEKLTARGYETLLLNEPLDEIFIQTVRHWKNLPFQDVARQGLKFGDEDPEAEKKELETLTEKFKPLLDFVKAEASHAVRDVVISNRLVTSPCAVVANELGYTANVERMLSAQNKKKENDWMFQFGKRQRILEINPKSPLIEGLLRRIERLPGPEEEKDLEAEDELKEVVTILVDGALVRSGFEVEDSHGFFTRVDRVLRRSLGVSETAPTDTTVEPAPEHVDDETVPPAEEPGATLDVDFDEESGETTVKPAERSHDEL